MPEFIQNPRRSPRAAARCRAAVVCAQGSFEATTEDVGGHGCQLVSPRLVRTGEPIQLIVAHEAMKERLRIAGRVAWTSDRAPWRLGIAYDEAALPASQAWFSELLGHVAGLSAHRRIPDRIALDAVIYLASPPRFLVDFTPDEVAILRALGSGTAVALLRSLLRDRWQQAQRALFSLLAHQHVTLARGASVHPDAWRKILSEAEASLAVEGLRGAPPVPARTPPPLRTATPAPRTATPPPLRPAGTSAAAGPHWTTAPQPIPEVAPPAPVPAPASGAPDWLVSAADLLPATWPTGVAAPAAPVPEGPRGLGRGLDGGIPWSATPAPRTGSFGLPAAPRRSQEAQRCYERALVELQSGQVPGAVALLRRALALAPGDPEIAGALARVMGQSRG